jgi:hypothetical protein
MAGAAVSFGSYEDPGSEVSSAISDASAWASDYRGNYDVKRKKPKSGNPSVVYGSEYDLLNARAHDVGLWIKTTGPDDYTLLRLYDRKQLHRSETLSGISKYLEANWKKLETAYRARNEPKKSKSGNPSSALKNKLLR